MPNNSYLGFLKRSVVSEFANAAIIAMPVWKSKLQGKRHITRMRWILTSKKQDRFPTGSS